MERAPFLLTYKERSSADIAVSPKSYGDVQVTTAAGVQAHSVTASKTGAPSLKLEPTELHGNGYSPLDDGEFAELRAGVSALSVVIDLPLRGAVIANLSAHELVAPDFRTEIASIVNGRKVATPLEASLPLAYAGSIAAHADSRVYLGFGRDEGASIVVGFIEIGEDSWWIADGGARILEAWGS